MLPKKIKSRFFIDYESKARYIFEENLNSAKYDFIAKKIIQQHPEFCERINYISKNDYDCLEQNMNEFLAKQLLEESYEKIIIHKVMCSLLNIRMNMIYSIEQINTDNQHAESVVSKDLKCLDKLAMLNIKNILFENKNTHSILDTIGNLMEVDENGITICGL